MMVMLITYPKTIWVDAPNAGKLALLHIHNSFDDLQKFANVHTKPFEVLFVKRAGENSRPKGQRKSF